MIRAVIEIVWFVLSGGDGAHARNRYHSSLGEHPMIWPFVCIAMGVVFWIVVGLLCSAWKATLKTKGV